MAITPQSYLLSEILCVWSMAFVIHKNEEFQFFLKCSLNEDKTGKRGIVSDICTGVCIVCVCVRVHLCTCIFPGSTVMMKT